MNTLKVKILGLITIIIVAIITVAALVNFQLQKQVIASVTKHNSRLLTETIKNSFATAMRLGHAEEIQNILRSIKSQESITSIRIIDIDGKIALSADSGEI